MSTWPKQTQAGTGLTRIIWHWSAGTHTVSTLDRQHYHFIIDGAGKVHAGNMPPEANLSTGDGQYAAHTRGCNTGSIGIAVAAMAGAVERPFNSGRFPITEAQIASLVALTRTLATKYGIPITRQTVLSHAEVQPTLKIAQRGKWDIAWLPGMASPGDPVKVGDKLRAMVAA
jgi:N-acetyl-anhydromuramyl-L-alanine amidase AmpD